MWVIEIYLNCLVVDPSLTKINYNKRHDAYALHAYRSAHYSMQKGLIAVFYYSVRSFELYAKMIILTKHSL